MVKKRDWRKNKARSVSHSSGARTSTRLAKLSWRLVSVVSSQWSIAGRRDQLCAPIPTVASFNFSTLLHNRQFQSIIFLSNFIFIQFLDNAKITNPITTSFFFLFVIWQWNSPPRWRSWNCRDRPTITNHPGTCAARLSPAKTTNRVCTLTTRAWRKNSNGFSQIFRCNKFPRLDKEVSKQIKNWK